MWVCNDIHEGDSNVDPADVALVSPQTPLTILFHPLLSGGYSKGHILAFPFAFELAVGFLRLHLQSSASTNSPP